MPYSQDSFLLKHHPQGTWQATLLRQIHIAFSSLKMRNCIWISASCIMGLARAQHHDNNVLLRRRDLANDAIQWRAPGGQEAIESTVTGTAPHQDAVNEALERGKGYYVDSKLTKSTKSSKADTKSTKSAKGWDDIEHLPPPPPLPPRPPQCGHPGLGQCEAHAQCKCKCMPNNPLEPKP